MFILFFDENINHTHSVRTHKSQNGPKNGSEDTQAGLANLDQAEAKKLAWPMKQLNFEFHNFLKFVRI